jgi:predicted DNA-binding transcriptional regulator YafY
MEYYYLVAFDELNGNRRNYRVEKIVDIAVSDEPFSEEAMKENFNSADYTQKIFGMYGGREELVSIECRESLAGVMIDRFGTEPTFHKTEGGFRFSARVMVSPNFFAWIMSFGSQVEIVSPEWVREKYLEELKATLDIYSKI